MTRFARLAAEDTAAGLVAVSVDCGKHEVTRSSLFCVGWLEPNLADLVGGGCFRALQALSAAAG